MAHRPLPHPQRRLRRLEGDLAEMLAVLEDLVQCESPSTDLGATKSCATLLARTGKLLLGVAPEAIEVEGRSHLRWRFGVPKVLLVGHLDTVWAVGTLARWPFSVSDGKASGPGVFDMKAGLVQMMFALRTIDDLDGVEIIVNSDEEIGSPTSAALIEEAAKDVHAAFVVEPSADGALKVARKGASSFELRVTGRAAHAGLEPEAGINATVELAHQILRIVKLADLDQGTTVTPTLASGGMSSNTVPAEGRVYIDVRVESNQEQLRVEKELSQLAPVLPGAALEIHPGPACAPLPESASAELFAKARVIAGELGLGELEGVAVGGGSDGNRTAGVGTPTLDGLGAVGGKAHAEGEYVDVSEMPRRAALLAELVAGILAQ